MWELKRGDAFKYIYTESFRRTKSGRGQPKESQREAKPLLLSTPPSPYQEEGGYRGMGFLNIELKKEDGATE